jgi:hypothetical protein
MKEKITLLLLFFAVLLHSCKKEQPALRSLEEDCDCAKEVSAEFLMEERTGLTDSHYKFTNTDTIYHNKAVRFTALDSTANYTWYIGAEKLNTRKVLRYFDQSLIGHTIPIILVVKKNANTICIPTDDGYDSIVKYLYVSQYVIDTGTDYEYGSIEGIYRVKSSHLLDSFDIVFYVSKSSSTEIMFNIENYDGLGSNCINQARATNFNYRQIFTSFGTSTTQCDYIMGDIHNRLDGVTEMNFTFFYKEHPDYKVRKYLGRRL